MSHKRLPPQKKKGLMIKFFFEDFGDLVLNEIHLGKLLLIPGD